MKRRKKKNDYIISSSPRSGKLSNQKTKCEYKWKELNERPDATKSAEYFGDEEEKKWLTGVFRCTVV